VGEEGAEFLASSGLWVRCSGRREKMRGERLSETFWTGGLVAMGGVMLVCLMGRLWGWGLSH
jgi:hypothetical protein